MSAFAAKNWNKEPITKDELTRMSQGIADAHTEIEQRAGLTLANTFTQSQTIDQAAPAAGQFNPYWTYRQAGADKIRYAMDDSGNLVVQRWTGAAWAAVFTFQVGSDTVLGSVDQVDGFHFRYNETLKVLEYSSDGETWTTAGLTAAQVRAIARRN